MKHLFIDGYNEETRSKYRNFILYGIQFIDEEDFMFVFISKKKILAVFFTVVCPRCFLHFEKLLSLKRCLSSMTLSYFRDTAIRHVFMKLALLR